MNAVQVNMQKIRYVKETFAVLRKWNIEDGWGTEDFEEGVPHIKRLSFSRMHEYRNNVVGYERELNLRRRECNA